MSEIDYEAPIADQSEIKGFISEHALPLLDGLRTGEADFGLYGGLETASVMHYIDGVNIRVGTLEEQYGTSGQKLEEYPDVHIVVDEVAEEDNTYKQTEYTFQNMGLLGTRYNVDVDEGTVQPNAQVLSTLGAGVLRRLATDPPKGSSWGERSTLRDIAKRPFTAGDISRLTHLISQCTSGTKVDISDTAE
jgi:hypothetical protein